MWKLCLGIAVGFALAIGLANSGMTQQARAAQVVAVDPGWRYHDGHWNYWDPNDKAWYHTDGKHWYTYNNNAWQVYKFDRGFGRKAFVREGYVHPPAGTEVVVPRHKVYVP